MLGIKFIKTQPTVHLMQFRKGTHRARGCRTVILLLRAQQHPGGRAGGEPGQRLHAGVGHKTLTISLSIDYQAAILKRHVTKVDGDKFAHPYSGIE